MPDPVKPYVEVKPGDLITADLFNTVQEDIKGDITQQITTSIGNIASVKHANDADMFGGQTVAQLTKSIIDQVKAMIPGRTGYMQTFNKLMPLQEKVIKHGLGAAPVVDVYQLDYFPAVCASDEDPKNQVIKMVNFYIYNDREGTITLPKDATDAGRVVFIEDPKRQVPFRIPFKDLLTQYKVDTSDTKITLDELENTFWDNLWATAGNDRFDPSQHCHSLWFEKCCGELRSYQDLSDRKDLERIWFKMEPRKTINYPTYPPGGSPTSIAPPTPGNLQLNGAAFPPTITVLPTVAPTQIQVVHFDFNTVGITLLADPVYPSPFNPFNESDPAPTDLKVMVIFKV